MILFIYSIDDYILVIINLAHHFRQGLAARDFNSPKTPITFVGNRPATDIKKINPFGITVIIGKTFCNVFLKYFRIHYHFTIFFDKIPVYGPIVAKKFLYSQVIQ